MFASQEKYLNLIYNLLCELDLNNKIDLLKCSEYKLLYIIFNRNINNKKKLDLLQKMLLQLQLKIKLNLSKKIMKIDNIKMNIINNNDFYNEYIHFLNTLYLKLQNEGGYNKYLKKYLKYKQKYLDPYKLILINLFFQDY